MTGPSNECYFNDILFVRVLTHDQLELIDGCEPFGVPWSPGFMVGLPPKSGFWKTIQVTYGT